MLSKSETFLKYGRARFDLQKDSLTGYKSELKL